MPSTETKRKAWRVQKQRTKNRQGVMVEGNLYYLCVSKALRPDLAGRKIPTKKTTREQAEAWAREFLKGGKQQSIATYQTVPLTDHLEAFHKMMIEVKKNTVEQADLIKSRLTKLFNGCGWTMIGDLEVYAAKRWIEQHAGSRRTQNHFVTHAKYFGKWLMATERMASDPFRVYDQTASLVLKVSKPTDAERKLIRRHLSTDELVLLRRTAEKGKSLRGISGKDRSMAYLLSAITGFRRNELASCAPESFRLKGDNPTLSVTGGYSKNGMSSVREIPRVYVPEIERWLDGKRPGKPVLPIRKFRTAEMIQHDLKAAGIPVETQDGVIDWHALRHTFGCHLALANIPPALAQQLMRHSTVELTTGCYSRVGASHRRDAVEKLPDFGLRGKTEGKTP